MNELSQKHLLLLIEIFELKNLEKASRVVGVSKSTASRMLNEMRELSKDLLFQRTGYEMHPTPYLTDNISLIRTSLNLQNQFWEKVVEVPPNIEYSFNIASMDAAFERFIVAPIAKALSTSNFVNFKVHNIFPEKVFQDLSTGRLDFLVFATQALPQSFHSFSLTKSRRVLVVNHTHPLVDIYRKKGSLKREDVEKFKLIRTQLDTPWSAAFSLPQSEKSACEIACQLPFVLDAPYLLLETNCIWLVAEWVALEVNSLFPGRFRAFILPGDDITLEPKLIWHERFHRSVPHQWFRSLVKEHIAGEESRETLSGFQLPENPFFRD